MSAPPSEAAAAPPPPRGPSVFRLRSVRDKPRFDMPLLLGSLSSSTRSAFACVHEGRRYLLTTAGAVAYGTQVRGRFVNCVGLRGVGLRV